MSGRTGLYSARSTRSGRKPASRRRGCAGWRSKSSSITHWTRAAGLKSRKLPEVYNVRDGGPGFDGSPQEIANLFSIDRGLVSSKLWRKPQRGALGNGLRVVAGVLIASGYGAALTIRTRNQELRITPHENGGASVEAKPADFPVGTLISVTFGGALPKDDDALLWAQQAIFISQGGDGYSGKSSPHWFDPDGFFELVNCHGARPVRDLIANLDGCTGAKAGAIAAGLLQRSCGSLSRDETKSLLARAWNLTKAPNVKRLGAVGPMKEFEGLPKHYARRDGYAQVGAANIPFVVEVWAEATQGQSRITVFVNRTPITGDAYLSHENKGLALFGCGMWREIDVPNRKGNWRVFVNITAPFVPITTDGKEPDLGPFEEYIVDAVSTAIKKAHRDHARKAPAMQGDSILPKRRRGVQSIVDDLIYSAQLVRFCAELRLLADELDFKVSARGWCYILEEHGLGKHEFAACEKIINKCRKDGSLPYDFCAEDQRRLADGRETIDEPDVDAELAHAVEQLRNRHEGYRPFSFWDGADVYVEVAVEKIDLKTLFAPICAEHHVLITNLAGWSDINARAAMMLKFKEMEAQGKTCVLLYFGDFDPGGLRISDFFRENLAELSKAVGWAPDNLHIERAGLNHDFIQEQGLTWIENLRTGGGEFGLDDPRHPDHAKPYVQEYLKRYCAKDESGKWQGRKVEANALVVRPDAGRQLCCDALARYIDAGALALYEAEIAERRKELGLKIEALLRAKGS